MFIVWWRLLINNDNVRSKFASVWRSSCLCLLTLNEFHIKSDLQMLLHRVDCTPNSPGSNKYILSPSPLKQRMKCRWKESPLEPFYQIISVWEWKMCKSHYYCYKPYTHSYMLMLIMGMPRGLNCKRVFDFYWKPMTVCTGVSLFFVLNSYCCYCCIVMILWYDFII